MEDEKLLTERILILIRNILDIPATPDDDKRTDDDASVHDQVLMNSQYSNGSAISEPPTYVTILGAVVHAFVRNGRRDYLSGLE